MLAADGAGPAASETSSATEAGSLVATTIGSGVDAATGGSRVVGGTDLGVPGVAVEFSEEVALSVDAGEKGTHSEEVALRVDAGEKGSHRGGGAVRL